RVLSSGGAPAIGGRTMSDRTQLALRQLAVSVAVLAATWLVAMLVGISVERVFGASRFVGIFLAAGAGLYTARRVGASFASVVILGCLLFVAVTLTARQLVGPGIIQGREVLLSLWAASVIGVALGFAAAQLRGIRGAATA